jgi:hypothetical protein
LAIVVARRSWLEISLRKTGKGRKKEKGAYKKEMVSTQPSSTAEIRRLRLSPGPASVERREPRSIIR